MVVVGVLVWCGVVGVNYHVCVLPNRRGKQSGHLNSLSGTGETR
jgi:hypothetical protein